MSHSVFSFLRTRSNVNAVGTKDGVNDTFSLPNGDTYIPASLEVYLNGQLISPDVIVKNSGYTTFTINDDLPISTDTLTVSYSFRS